MLALMLPVNLFSQQHVRFERISLEHGLSQSIVRVIFQDSKGFLWFGAQDGLNKYDGYKFTVYKYDPFDSTSLSENDIWSIYEAPSEPKVLWIGTGASGLNRFDRETETFTHFRHNPADPASLSNNFVGQIYEDRAGNLWVLTGAGGLDRLDRKTPTGAAGKFVHYRHDTNNPNSLSHDRITAFHESATEPGVLWIGTPAGLNRFDAKTGRFTRYRHEPDHANSLSFDGVLSIYEAATEPGILWIGTGPTDGELKGGGLNRFDTKSGTFTCYRYDPRNPNSISSDIVGPVYEDKHGTLWVGTLAGLDKFDRQTPTEVAGTFTPFALNANNPNFLSHAVAFIFADSKGCLWIRTPLNDGIHRFDPRPSAAAGFIHCRFDPNDPRSLSNDVVFAIFEDRSGVLWLGTQAGGLNKLDQYAEKFKVFVPEPNNPNSLSNFMVRAIHEDRSAPNTLWIGVAQGGLNQLDRKTPAGAAGKFTHYRHDPKNPNSLSNDNVWAIFEDRAGELWVGTLGGGLDKFDRHKKAFTHYRHDPASPHSLSDDNIRAIYEDRLKPGVLWIGTDGGGLNRFDLKTNQFIHWQNDPKNPNSLSNNFVRAIHQDRSGVLWLGTVGGFNKFDPETNGFKRYLHDATNPNSLGGNIVQSIYEDSTGVLWLGTYGGGLNRFDPKTEQFTVYTENNSGLSNNAVYATLPDDHGNLWLSTNAGVCKFNPKFNTFKTYDVDDGLQSREFNGQAYFKSPSGEMFFGGIIGLNAFYPDSVKDNPIAPQLALTDFKLFNESVSIGGKSPLKKHISATDSITLAYWQNDISLEFVALHYGRPENNHYAYMLENYDDEWRQAGTQRVATYTNLDPGKYIFRVKGSNNDGVWNEAGISIRITITPPLWKTSAAYGVYALLLIAGIVAVERLHRARLIAKERENAYLREAELRAEAAEAKARAIQAENERKTLELEEARKLQLSMLPKTLPSLPNFDIAVYMQTANEVGGDYYDFMLHEDGTLTAAIGDATGHGLQAGTMVAATKSLFNSLAHMPHPVPILAEASHALRGMGFHNMYMAMTIAKFKERRMRLATAGMPYTLIYRAATRCVEEVELKGLPLGSFSDVQYQWKDLNLDMGDTVLFMSDGFSEMFNTQGEILGEDRAKALFKKVGHTSSEQIVEHLVDAGKAWANGQSQKDDVTLVVVKVK